MNKFANIIILLLLFTVLPVFAAAQSSNVTFNYSGLVRVSGTPYNGTGEFKLAIVSVNGNLTLWSHDGTSANGSEPTSFISSAIADGVFSINVGDVSEGMDPINRTLFNNDTKNMRLRIWFNDGVNGFERLTPDRKLNNIEILGLTSGDGGVQIYVDANSGSDENDGLTTDTAKATVQAGINIIPAFIESPVVVNILPGIYYEEVEINNIRIGSADGSLTILGDELNPPVISGADEGTSNAILDTVMRIDSTDRFSIENITFESGLIRGVMVVGAKPQFTNCVFDNFSSPSTNETFCLESNSFSDVLAFNCIFQNSTNGLRTGNTSRLGLFNNCQVIDIDRYGALSFGASFFRANDSTFQNCGIGGVSIREGSLLTMFSTTVDSCGFSEIDDVFNVEALDNSYAKLYACNITNARYGGIKSTDSSHVQFLDTGLGNTLIDNCPTGILAEYDSVVRDRNSALTFGTNPTDATADSSSHLFDIP